ncbi:MAG TPA: DUF362 domain-containing protein [Clostridia bacterium]|nr:DUF362 domain-containing protein [Clostridia bacterium]
MNSVAFGATVPVYNHVPPFHPDTRYPELPFSEVSTTPNWPYALLRDLFVALGLDCERYGSAQWNPLGTLVQPGQTVFLKPNFVLSFNEAGRDLFALVTHPSILRALVDYVYIALRGQGRIIVADSPQMDCQWGDLMRAQHLDSIQEFYQSRFRFPVEVYDLRDFVVIDPRQPALTTNRQALPGDPAGSVIVNLGQGSHFYGLANENYYGADYNRQETIAHHRGTTQEYCVSRTALSADVFISVPKMKTHKKVGVTLNLKGLVGINTNKNYLVHYRLGTPKQGGDQLPDGPPGKDRLLVKIQRLAYDKLLARQSKSADAVYAAIRKAYHLTLKPLIGVSDKTLMVDAGNWHGNDSAWRMTADLAKILFFCDAAGKIHSTPQRKMFCVVDGIVGGDRLGPLTPDARRCGCLVAGEHPMVVDLVTTRLMGFDPRKLRQFDLAFDSDWEFGLKSFADILVHCPRRTCSGDEFFSRDCHDSYYGFTPHPGWKGQIEA